MQKGIEANVVNQLKRVVGQVNKLITVIDSTDCEAVLMQLKAAEKSIKSVSIAVLKNHMENCVVDGLKTDPQKTSDDFNKLLDRYL